MNRFILILSASLVIPCGANAADILNDESLIPDLSRDESMAAAPAGQKAFVPSFGGWFSPMILSETKSAYSLTTSMNVLRLWGRLSLGGNCFLYVRGRESYTAVIAKDKVDISNKNELDLDSGFIELATPARAFTLDAGRKFFSVGSGLVVNGRGDGGDITVKTPFADLYAAGFYTGLIDKDSNPYGLSEKDLSDGAKRAFAIGSVEKSFANQTVYLFAVMQKDYADEDDAVKVRYDSQYFGAGLRGDLGGGVDYYAEGIYERGKGYAQMENMKKTDVEARAAVAGVSWYPDAAGNPSFTVQYGYGSGDSDRASATLSSGNQYGKDTAFVPFGTFSGGYAFRPVLSNLHVVRGGPTVMPFASSTTVLKYMSIGARYDAYWKATSGPVNNNEISSPNGKNRFVGHGADLIFRWAVFCDLAVYVNYGIFIPGSALPEEEMVRHFVTGGMTVAF